MSDASRPSALHLLHRAGQCADEVFASQIAESDMTPRQFAVLRAIADSAEPVRRPWYRPPALTARP